MGRVDVFLVDGCSLWFNSHDHSPPHFHADAVDWEVRVHFMEEPPRVERKWGDGPRGRSRAELVRLARKHRVELLSEWEKKVHRSEEAEKKS